MDKENHDDFLIWVADIQELENRVATILKRCSELNVTNSKSKFEICDIFPFADLLTAKDGVRPNPKRTAALSHFLVPAFQSNVRSSLGLVNQLALFIPDFAHSTPTFYDN